MAKVNSSNRIAAGVSKAFIGKIPKGQQGLDNKFIGKLPPYLKNSNEDIFKGRLSRAVKKNK